MAGLSFILSQWMGDRFAASLENQFSRQAQASAALPVLVDQWQADSDGLERLVQEWAALLGARAHPF